VCSLTNNSIGDEGGKSIAAVLPQSKITSLCLKSNSIEVEGGKAIALVLKDTQMTHFDFSFNRLRDGKDRSAVYALAAAMKECKQLKTLDVRGTKLDNAAEFVLEDAASVSLLTRRLGKLTT